MPPCIQLPLLMPYWRATSVDDAPGARLCAAIVASAQSSSDDAARRA
jgi:hypothetical protein